MSKRYYLNPELTGGKASAAVTINDLVKGGFLVPVEPVTVQYSKEPCGSIVSLDGVAHLVDKYCACVAAVEGMHYADTDGVWFMVTEITDDVVDSRQLANKPLDVPGTYVMPHAPSIPEWLEMVGGVYGLGEADVWHAGSASFYRAKLLYPVALKQAVGKPAWMDRDILMIAMTPEKLRVLSAIKEYHRAKGNLEYYAVLSTII